MFAELERHDFADEPGAYTAEPDAYTAELGQALAMLQATKDLCQDDPATPNQIHHKDVERIPNVFQVRGGVVVQSHVSELLVLLKQGRKLDPITLWRCGRHALLVDGHHRIAAYKQYELHVKKPVPVPCEWFEGSAVQAMEVAAETNTKVKLPMTHAQRTDFAWKMVKAGPDRFTKSQTAKLAGVSSGTVAEMRRTLKQLGEMAEEVVSWAAALMKVRGLEPLTDEQHKMRDALTVGKWVETLRRNFKDRWYKQQHLVSDALDVFLGPTSVEVARDWCLGSEYMGREAVEGWLKEEDEMAQWRMNEDY